MNPSVKFGLIAGVTTAAFSFAITRVEISNATVYTLLQFIPITVNLACIFLSVKSARDRAVEIFDIKTALKAGVITGVVASLIGTAAAFFHWYSETPESLMVQAKSYAEKEIATYPPIADTAAATIAFNQAVKTADSALALKEFNLAWKNYCKAIAIDSTATGPKEKLDYIVQFNIAHYKTLGNFFQSSSMRIVTQILIAFIIALISFFLIKKKVSF
jgi:hypothetical protein